MKIALGIEYCGTSYYGWQRQATSGGIQEFVEKSLSKIADQEIIVSCAGRTDTGVHALHQVVHFETDIERDLYSWVAGGNVNLPHDISVLWAKRVDDEFHARFSAIARTYRYIILNRQTRPGLHMGKVTWERRALDESRMQSAAKFLIGEHDFTSFRTVACQAKSPNRDVKRLDVRRVDDYVILEIEANAFLHHMVRNIAGVLIRIGRGEAEVSWASEILALKDRTKAAKTAAADGLYLAMIRYPEKYGIPVPVVSQYAMTTI